MSNYCLTKRLGHDRPQAAGTHQPSQGGDQVHQQDERVAPRNILIGSEGGLPLPSAHTTVRTVPYTAVQVLRCRSRS